jgi:AcrR family transcriptional regulator
MAETEPGPTGAARRRARLRDSETERRMLDAALALITERGLTVSLEHLSMEEVIGAAGVSRASAYRRWPYKDLFFGDVLVELARATELSDHSHRLAERVRAVLPGDAAQLRTEAGRRDLAVELVRMVTEANVEAISSAPAWLTYLAVNATFLGLPEGEVRGRVGAAVAEATRRFTAGRAAIYAEMAQLLGYRLVPPLTAPEGFELMSAAVGSMATGLVVRGLAEPELIVHRTPRRPFGSTREAPWSTAVFLIAGVIMSFVEPDPAVVWDEARIRSVGTAGADPAYPAC